MNSCLLSWWPCENALQDAWCRILKMQNKEKEKLFFFLSSSGRQIVGREKNSQPTYESSQFRVPRRGWFSNPLGRIQ